MSQDLPTLPDLLRVVRDFIEGVKDEVPDKDRYHALCCIHLLAIAERELTQGARLEAAETDALNAFLGKSHDPGDALRAFASGLRAGRFDDQWEAATDLVLRTVIDKVMIAKPDHLHPMHREESQ